jgi:hypothetical protein
MKLDPSPRAEPAAVVVMPVDVVARAVVAAVADVATAVEAAAVVAEVEPAGKIVIDIGRSIRPKQIAAVPYGAAALI